MPRLRRVQAKRVFDQAEYIAMKLIVGLGNPGRKYEQTRHNVGFMAATRIAVLSSAESPKIKFEGEFAEGRFGGQKLSVLCPHTFMNASGQSVRKAMDFFKLEPDDILVVCDDLNLATGRLRIRRSGSAGGQNGLKDIIRHLDSQDFPRLRIGIGRPPSGWEVSDYVLGKFNKSEHDEIEAATTRAAHGALEWVANGIADAMNKFNADPNATPKRKTQVDKPSDGSTKTQNTEHNQT